MNCCWYGISPSIFGYYRCFWFCCRCCCRYWMNAKVNMHHWCCSQLIWMQNRHLILPFLRAKKPNKKSWQVIKCRKNLRHLHTSHVITSRNAAAWLCPIHCCSSIQREKIKIEISNKTDIGKKVLATNISKNRNDFAALSPLAPSPLTWVNKKLISSKSKLLKRQFLLPNSNGSSSLNDVNPKKAFFERASVWSICLHKTTAATFWSIQIWFDLIWFDLLLSHQLYSIGTMGPGKIFACRIAQTRTHSFHVYMKMTSNYLCNVSMWNCHYNEFSLFFVCHTIIHNICKWKNHRGKWSHSFLLNENAHFNDISPNANINYLEFR